VLSDELMASSTGNDEPISDQALDRSLHAGQGGTARIGKIRQAEISLALTQGDDGLNSALAVGSSHALHITTHTA